MSIKKIIPLFLRDRIKAVYFYYQFIKEFLVFKKQAINSRRFDVKWSDRYPQLFDRTTSTNFDTHYIYHPAWATRIVKKINPAFHVDISSTLTFASMLSAFIPVKFYDFRPANLKLDNLESGEADLLKLPFESNSIKSLSCMHTIEHLGLGRYGDPLGADNDLKAIGELKRVLAHGGNFIYAGPIGKSKLMFNAHRIYSYDQIIEYFSDLKLKEFSLIPDNAIETGIINNATKELSDQQNYGCGLFWFTKE